MTVNQLSNYNTTLTFEKGQQKSQDSGVVICMLPALALAIY